MLIGERLKYLRKNLLGLTLEKFGEQLGVTKTAISLIESGKNTLTEQNIIAICKTSWNGKYVNEDWLRTGEGEVFLEPPEEDEFFKYVAQLSNREEVRAAIIALGRRPREEQETILGYIRDTSALYHQMTKDRHED